MKLSFQTFLLYINRLTAVFFKFIYLKFTSYVCTIYFLCSIYLESASGLELEPSGTRVNHFTVCINEGVYINLRDRITTSLLNPQKGVRKESDKRGAVATPPTPKF